MMKRNFIILLFIFIPCNCFPGEVSNKLTEVLTQIKNVKLLLQKHQSQQKDLQKELQKTELSINKISMQLHKTTLDLDQKNLAIHLLTSEQKKITDRIKKQQQVLLKQIRMTYMLGLDKNKYQFLFKTNDPNKINRLLIYNRYLTLQNNNLITDLKSNLITLKNNKQTILAHANYLVELKRKQVSQHDELDNNKQTQQAILNNVSLKVKTHSEQLNELLKNKKNLENVIQQLQRKETYSSDFLTHHNSKFPWPTAGKVIEKFGSNIQNSELKQNGVLISAPEGQKVYAVAPGRVVFANWMPGYGLLLIIDHGKGYMTLYGNNGVLYKKNHELVSNKELIAAVGHSGGQQKPVLYFALRYKGRPVDPATWIK